MGGNMCGVIATECKAEGCNNMARYDLWCWRCMCKIGDGNSLYLPNKTNSKCVVCDKPIDKDLNYCNDCEIGEEE